jgi:hypothetical protein
MIEKVARLVNPEAWLKLDTGDGFERMNWHGRRELSKDLARKILEAMREPTQPMLAATEDVVVGYDDFACDDGTLYLSHAGSAGHDGFHEYAKTAWQAMITAALEETP